jgi:hypothetical protein
MFYYYYYFKTVKCRSGYYSVNKVNTSKLILKLEIDERIISSPRIPFDVAIDVNTQ